MADRAGHFRRRTDTGDADFLKGAQDVSADDNLAKPFMEENLIGALAELEER